MTLEPDDIRFHLTSSQQFGVRASMLLLHHNQLLVYRDCDYRKTTFIVPGGAIKFNETGQEAAVRETLEEVGIRIANPEFAGFIEAFWTNDHKSFHQITMVFRHEVTLAESKQLIDLHEENLDLPADTKLIWRPITQLEDQIQPRHLLSLTKLGSSPKHEIDRR
ncbi:MAG: NUDIX domain-containing protein [Lactobacillus sp.]